MSLERDFCLINMDALDILNVIHGIQIGYLSSNKKYPYNDVNSMLMSYRVLFNKYNKKKNSILNKMINRFSKERCLISSQLNLMDDRQILVDASKKSLFYVCARNDKYIPDSEESVFIISNKLFPIIKDLEIDTIVSLYHKFKNCVQDDHDKDNKLLYLQQLYMGYVMYKLRIHNVDKRTSKLNYEEACKYILGEDVLDLSGNYKKRTLQFNIPN